MKIDVLKKVFEIKTIVISIITVSMASYYAQCYYHNEILIFNKNDNVIILGLLFGLYWMAIILFFLYLKNRNQIKKLEEKDEMILDLLNKILEQNAKQGTRSEQHYDGIQRSNKQIKEMIIDSGEWSA